MNTKPNLTRLALENAGEDAFRDGKDWTECPYEHPSNEGRWWLDGWQTAMLEEQARQAVEGGR
jgi:ribosome modulation factor